MSQEDKVNNNIDVDNENDDSKNPKMKVAIVFGYVGYGYYGLQYNYDPVRPTIELEIINALNQVGYISDENMIGQFLKKICWERASRTDKGVSALRNVANARLQLPKGKTEKEWIEPVNKILLPKKMKIFRILATTSSFDAYNSCTGRKYEYLLPTYALLPPQDAVDTTDAEIEQNRKSEEIRQVLTNIAADPESSRYQRRNAREDDDDADQQQQDGDQQQKQQQQQGGRRRQRDDPTIDPEEAPFQEVYLNKMIKYRVTSELIHKLRGFFTVMEGTNSFHNFTPVATADDACASRFIRSIEVSDPYLISIPIVLKDGKIVNNRDDDDDNNPYRGGKIETIVADVEYVRIRLDGQSFMLNQIRKMIGGAIEVLVRGGDATMVRGLFSKNLNRMAPMAPANGLFLATMSLDKYNHKLERLQSQGGSNGIQAKGKEAIIIPDVKPDDEMRTLVEKCIAEQECKDQITARWICGLLKTKEDDFKLKPLVGQDVEQEAQLNTQE